MKKLIITLSLIIAVCAFTCTASATTRGLEATLTKTRAVVTYTYGSPGAVLKARGDFSEKHKTTKHEYIHYFENVSAGSYDSVTAYRNADEGYEYTSLVGRGYYNGNLDMKTSEIHP